MDLRHTKLYKNWKVLFHVYVDLDDDNKLNKPAGQEVTVATGQQQQPDSSSSSSSGNESEDDGRGANTDAQRETDEEFVYKQWRRFGFFDPLRVVFQLSAGRRLV